MSKFLSCALCCVVFGGCAKRIETASPDPISFAEDDSEVLISVVLDMSPSFEDLMKENGKAFEFLAAILDTYFRNRTATSDTLLISQISGESRALIWQGSPQEFREEFSGRKDFKKFLEKKSIPAGSRVFDSIADTVEYITSEPRFESGKMKSGILVISDLEDSAKDSRQSRERAVKALEEYGSKGGLAGFYYVRNDLIKEWRSDLKDAGVKKCVVMGDFVGKPKLPKFSDE